MSSSFEKINYNLRPNKSIERKMIVEALSRLSLLEPLPNFRYIGMGSAYFTDFILMHKHLGLTDLISIEEEENKKNRFEFNKPYTCVDIKWGKTTTVLPNLELDKKKNIVWLDYDSKICDYMFSDIDTFFSMASAGSVFLLSVNVEADYLRHADTNMQTGLSEKEYRLKELQGRVGEERLPNEFLDKNFSTRNTIDACLEMINRQIESTLLVRNKTERAVKYRQLFNFEYSDNATMLTVGGIIFSEAQKPKIDEMLFEKIDFVRTGVDMYKINAPNLTVREIKALEKALPDKHNLEVSKGKYISKALQSIPLIPTDIDNFAKVYRYFPSFAEAMI